MVHWPLICGLLHLVQREGPGRPSPLLAVPNVRAHPSTASVPTSYYSMWHYNYLRVLNGEILKTFYLTKKSTFRTKNGGDLGQGSIQTKFGTPYLFLLPLKLATSYLVHNFGLGLAYQKRLRSKLAGAWARGASEKIWDPLFISATAKASDWKIVTQHEFRFTLPNTSFRTKLGRVWIRRVGLPLPPHYDNDATVYSTCHRKLTGAQISLLSGIKQKI